MTTITTGRWRPLPLIICNLVALLLIGSWWLAPGRELWDRLDTWVFYALNATLSDGAGWQLLWAMANTRQFDTVAGLVILSLYGLYMLKGDREQFVQRFTVGVIMTIVTLLALTIAKFTLDYGRAGPSLVMDQAVRLTDIITDFKFKDRSGSSFPSDHAIIVFIVSGYFWVHVGRRYGLGMLALSVFLLLPRMYVGAHWLSDSLVGSAFIALLVLGWVLATPLQARLLSLLEPWVSKILNSIERLIIRLAGDRPAAARELLDSPRHVLKGFCMGSADIIPGVSGGTMALIMGIYERLLEAIRSFDRKWLVNILRLQFKTAIGRNDLLFLLPLFVGILLAIAFFTRIIPLPTLIVTQPEIIYGLFFGLILASIVILMGEVDRYRLPQIALTIIGTGLGLSIVNLVPVETPNALWFIYLSGVIAISAMLLPGISGSFLLLILGKYAYIINALGNVDIPVILTFALGALTGIIIFSHTIVWLMHHYHQQTLLVIKGILIGSLWMIWPFQDRVYETVREKQRLVGTSPIWPESFTSTVGISIGLMIAGFAAVMLLHAMSRRKHAAPGL